MNLVQCRLGGREHFSPLLSEAINQLSVDWLIDWLLSALLNLLANCTTCPVFVFSWFLECSLLKIIPEQLSSCPIKKILGFASWIIKVLKTFVFVLFVLDSLVIDEDALYSRLDCVCPWNLPACLLISNGSRCLPPLSLASCLVYPPFYGSYPLVFFCPVPSCPRLLASRLLSDVTLP